MLLRTCVSLARGGSSNRPQQWLFQSSFYVNNIIVMKTADADHVAGAHFEARVLTAKIFCD